MVIRNQAEQVLLVMNNLDGCAVECWTPRLAAPAVKIEMTGSPTASYVIADAVALLSAGSQSMYSPNPDAPSEPLFLAGFGNIDQRNRVRRLGDKVGMFVTSGKDPDGKSVSWCCSGVVVAKDLFMTNWHCGAANGREDTAFWTSEPSMSPCSNGFVDLSWDGDSVRREYTCDAIEYTNKALDVAVMRLRPVVGTTGSPSIGEPISIAAARPSEGNELLMIHHAECKPKLISQSCRVVAGSVPGWTEQSSAVEFGHNCSTEGGSSGAPVFNEDLELVGLHHLGFGCDEDKQYNKALPIADILSDISTAKPALQLELVQPPEN